MLCIKIKLSEAEKAKREIALKGLIDSRYLMMREGEFFYIPVLKRVFGYNLVEKALKERKALGNFSDAVKKILNSDEMKHFNGAYDAVGSIGIIEVDRELEKREKEIALILLKTDKKVKTVVKKFSEHKGEFRLQNYRYLAGVDKFETLHKESGVVLKLDIRKTYYSVRSAGERLRIASQIKKRENVLVMFSGVGIYPFVFAKHSDASKILGVEINPDACFYASESLKLNKFKNIELACADVRDYFKNYSGRFFDRIVMPLPKNAGDFLDVAAKLIKKKGIIHFYFFDNLNVLGDYSRLNSLFSKYFKRFKVLKVVKAGQQSPGVYRLCADVQIL